MVAGGLMLGAPGKDQRGPESLPRSSDPMTKPNEFRKTYVLSTDVSYHASQEQKGTHAGDGMLHQGRVVWLENDPQPNIEVAAYAEGVGVVLLAPEAVQPVR